MRQNICGIYTQKIDIYSSRPASVEMKLQQIKYEIPKKYTAKGCVFPF